MNILYSLLIKLIFSYVYPKADVLCYYNVLEQKIENGVKVNWFWTWLFCKQDVKIFGTVYRQAVPRYRVFHAFILIMYWGLAWLIFYRLMDSNVWLSLLAFSIDFAGVAWAYYKMLFERLYYTISDTNADLVRYQRDGEDVYWLKRKWFYGYKCFRISFLVHVFDESAIVGGIGMYLTSLIHLII